MLPAPPARILEVGSGPGTLLADLLELGYVAVGINQDPAQVALARACFGSNLPLFEARYEDWNPVDESHCYDVIVFQESLQHIDTLHLLDRALDLITHQGRIVLVDEFVIRHNGWMPPPIHLYNHIVSLASRLGFEVEKEEELTEKGASTIDLMLKTTNLYRVDKLDELQRPELRIDDLQNSKRATRDGYANGRVGRRLLVLKRTSDPSWRLRAVTSSHYDEFSSLFRERFGTQMSFPHWEWKYGDGRGYGVGVWIKGNLSAHYGCIFRPALVFGRQSNMYLPGDVMTRRGSHRNLGRRSPYFAAAATFQEIIAGFGTPNLVHAGFPNAHHQRGLRSLGLISEPYDRVMELHWPLSVRDGRTESRRITEPDDIHARRIVDFLWMSMANDLQAFVVAIRDWDSLTRRYLLHPDKAYDIHIVPDPEREDALGVVVLRRTNDESFELMDLVGPLDKMPAMVRAARSIAASEGAQDLWGWFAEHCVADRIAGSDCEVRDINVVSSTSIWRPGIPVEELRGRVWLTSGDTDFH